MRPKTPDPLRDKYLFLARVEAVMELQREQDRRVERAIKTEVAK
jgi:hypothetical protein